MVDIAVGVVIALIVGVAAMKMLPLFARHAGRGFAVVTKSDGDSPAA